MYEYIYYEKSTEFSTSQWYYDKYNIILYKEGWSIILFAPQLIVLEVK